MSDELASELRVVVGMLTRKLREQGSAGDLPRSQLSVLGRLDREGPATASALAQAEGMRPQSMGAIVSALEAGGYIAGHPDPSDGRRVILSVTDATREQFRVGRLAREDYLARAISSTLTVAEQKQLAIAVELLRKLV